MQVFLSELESEFLSPAFIRNNTRSAAVITIISAAGHVKHAPNTLCAQLPRMPVLSHGNCARRLGMRVDVSHSGGAVLEEYLDAGSF